MNRITLKVLTFLLYISTEAYQIFFNPDFSFALISSSADGKTNATVTIVQPQNNEKLSNPVKICMAVEGMILEHADNGVSEGHGHHHILFSYADHVPYNPAITDKI